MRDTHEGMPELLSAYQRGEEFFGAVEVTLGSECRQFEFGATRMDYSGLCKIITARPFDRLSILQYRYFIVDSVCRLPESNYVEISIRVEQGQTGRQLSFKVPITLASSLLFFARLRDFSNASHLHAPNQALH